MSCLLLAVGLRAYRLGYQSLWADEITTLLNSSGSLHQVIFHPVINSNIPPLYYMVIHGMLKFGSDEYLLRLPSVAFGSISIVVFFLIVRNWLGRNIGLTSMVLITISPFHVWYSQEARPYMLLLLLALLSVLLVQSLLHDPKNGWVRIGFVLTSAAMFYCHTVAIAFIAFLAAYVALASSREDFKFWLLNFSAITLLSSPALYLLIVTPPTNPGNPFESFHPLSFAYVIWTFGTGFSLGPTLPELHMPGRMATVFSYLPIILPSILFISGLCLIGTIHIKRERPSMFWVVTMWFVFPLAFATLGALVTVHPFNVRYAILSFPAFIILLSYGIERFPMYGGRLGTFGIIVLISVLSLFNYFYDQRYQRDNNRAAGQFLSIHALPNDVIITSAPYTAKNLRYYSRRDDITIVGYPTPRRYRLEGVASQKKQKLDRSEDSVGESFAVGGELKGIIDGRERFWLFLSRTYHSDPKGYILKFCDEHFRRELEGSWNDARLILYRTRNEVMEDRRAEWIGVSVKRVPVRRVSYPGISGDYADQQVLSRYFRFV